MIKKYIKYISAFFGLSLLALSQTATAQTFALPTNGDNIIGEVQMVRARPGETLSDIGRRYDIGYYEMVEANPDISPERSLPSWKRVVIPSQFILPPGPRTGIVINLAELRLYYYLPGGGEVLTEPVGIGREGWATPLGQTKIVSKVKNPTWRPTPDTHAEARRLGYELPDVWPPGPNNPLGEYKMRLGWGAYLIHGTNQPSGVGKRSSGGCLRMYPEGIEELYPLVSIGTPVRIINKPIKVGWQDGIFYLEAHKPLKEKGKYVKSDTVNMVSRIYEATKGRKTAVKWREAYKEVKAQTGVPRVIGGSHG